MHYILLNFEYFEYILRIMQDPQIEFLHYVLDNRFFFFFNQLLSSFIMHY